MVTRTHIGRTHRWAALLPGLVALALALALAAAPSAHADVIGNGDLAPSIWSDKDDYRPGELVTLTGAGWRAGETVQIHVNDAAPSASTWNRTVDVTADETGAITDRFDLPNWFVADYHVKATGSSGSVATTTFTDGNLGVTSGPVATGAGEVKFTLTPKLHKLSGDCKATTTVNEPARVVGSTTNGSEKNTWTLGVDQKDSVQLEASATASQPAGWSFKHWATKEGAVVDPIDAANPRVICVTGNFTGTRDYVAVYQQQRTTSLATAPATGTYGGTTKLSATLTSGSAGIDGKRIEFTRNGAAVGAATTNSSGVATLDSVSLGSIGAGTHAPGASSGITASFAGDATNKASSGANALTVAKAPLTVTADAKSRAYGAANPTLTGKVEGVKNGETISGVYTTTATAMSGVGSHAITAAAEAGAGASLGNYAVTAVEGALSVTKAPLTVTADDRAREYGDANPALTGTLTGVRNEDAITATYATPADKGSKVGTYAITPKVEASAAVLANYATPSLTDGTLTVRAAPLSVKADAKSREYGEANPTLTGTLTGVKNGDALAAGYSTTATETSGVGAYAVTPNVSGDDAALANYQAPTLDPAALTVTKAPLTVTAADTTKRYGDGNPILTGKVEGAKNGDTLVDSYTTAATEHSGVGSYAVQAAVKAGDGASLGNYDVKLVDGKLTITAAKLTVTAADKTKVYGEANPALTGTVEGVKNDDELKAGFSTAATEKSGVGVYAIEAAIAGERLGNYEVEKVAAKLSITKAALTVTAAGRTKVYGDENPGLTGTVTGIRNDDAITGSYATAATQATGVGSYAIQAAVNAGEGASLGNYDVTLVDGQLSITKAPLSVTAAGKAKVYGDENPELTGTVVGVKNADKLVDAYTTAATAKTGVGSHAIQASVKAGEGASLSNYDITLVDGKLSITKAPLSVKAADKEKVYGDENPDLTGAITGIRNDDAITASYTTTAEKGSAAGRYAIVPNVVAADEILANYGVPALEGGTLTVAKAPLEVTADSKSKTYGEANPALTGKVEGVKNDDALEPSYSTTATEKTGVGEAAITAAIDGERLGNYEVTLVDGTLTITKAPLSVKAADESRAYGDENPELTGSITGIRNGDAITATYSTAATQASGVGDHVIRAAAKAGDGASLANYDVALVDGKLTINKATLTGTVSDETVTYGTKATFSITSWAGLKNGEQAAAVVTGTLACKADVNAGPSRPVACSGLGAENYAIAYTGGSLEVDQAELEVNANDASMTYRGAKPALTSTLTGYANGETKETAGVSGAAACEIAASATAAGAHQNAITCAPGGLTAKNYTFSAGSKGTLTVAKADQRIAFPAIASRVLGSGDVTPAAAADSKVDGLAVSYTAGPATVCAIVDGKVRLVGVGTCKVTASQAGDGNWNAAAGVDQTFSIHYRWDGFLQPINDTAHQTGVAQSKFRLGQTIPAKFQIKDAAGASLQQAVLPGFTFTRLGAACDSGAVLDTYSADAATGGTTYRWDAGLNGYIYNWNTRGLSAGQYRMHANLNDGKSRSVDICLTK